MELSAHTAGRCPWPAAHCAGRQCGGARAMGRIRSTHARAQPRQLSAMQRRRSDSSAVARAEADSGGASVQSSLDSLNKLYPSECVRVDDDGDDEEPEEEILECRVFLDDGEATNVKVSAEKGAGATLLTLNVALPLGVVFEEAGGQCVCVEVDPQGNAAGALREGDVLRACSACVKTMSYPTGNLLLGGIGRPVAKRVMHRLPSAREWTEKAFGQAMAALQSNRKERRDVVALVVERRRGGGGRGT